MKYICYGLFKLQIISWLYCRVIIKRLDLTVSVKFNCIKIQGFLFLK